MKKKPKKKQETFANMRIAAARLGWPLQALIYAKNIDACPAFHLSGRVDREELERWMTAKLEELYNSNFAAGTHKTGGFYRASEAHVFWLLLYAGDFEKARKVAELLTAAWGLQDEIAKLCGDEIEARPSLDIDANPLERLGKLDPKTWMISRKEYKAEWKPGEWPLELIYDE